MLAHPNLQSIIHIYQGHGALPDAPEWTGTIEAYWEGNQGLTLADIRELQDALARHGYQTFGGGAEACFTICTPAHARAQRMRTSNIVDRMASKILDFGREGVTADDLATVGFTRAEIARHGQAAADLASQRHVRQVA